MPRRLGRTLSLTLWLATGILILLWWYLNREAPESGLAFGWLMVIIGFPSSAVATSLFGLVVMGLDSWLKLSLSKQIQVLLLWLVAMSAGYFQWFWLMPRVARGLVGIWKERRSRSEK